MDQFHSPKPMSASRIQLAQIMMPEHANTQGNVHGGWIMKLVDEAGGLASTRHAGHRTVTVAIDQMFFHHPIHIGDLVLLNAEVTYTGRTSMEVEVKVTAENPISGEKIFTNAAYLVYVAIDNKDKPTQVPPLVAESPEEQARMDAAAARQHRRLAQNSNRI
ncbi:MAG: acyl-CoA thioesterase [Anaerolineales bacterium]|jgi:acyl-CoA hydrolase